MLYVLRKFFQPPLIQLANDIAPRVFLLIEWHSPIPCHIHRRDSLRQSRREIYLLANHLNHSDDKHLNPRRYEQQKKESSVCHTNRPTNDARIHFDTKYVSRFWNE